MRVVMLGAGYVGLVTGFCFAEIGHTVVCVDNDRAKINLLNRGQIPIYEPGLQELLERNVQAGRLSFSTDLAAAIGGCAAIFIAVGTPSRKGDGQADLSYVFSAAAEVARNLDHSAAIVTKSTVQVGTNRAVAEIIRSVRPELDFEVASNPEFLREGAAIDDFMNPDRVVIGVENERSESIMKALYKPIADRGAPVVFTDLESAEMVKYASNAFLAMKVTFINEVAGLCEKVGADIAKVAHGMGLDRRIGDRFLNPGPGYGGSCFPKDTLAFARTGQIHGNRLNLVESTIATNMAVKTRMVEKIVSACGGSVAGKDIGVLGATFKADTDDMRDAPSLTIIPALTKRGAHVTVYEPQRRHEGERLLPEVRWSEDPYHVATGADAVVAMTEWTLIRELDLRKLASLMRTPVLVDLRNLFDEETARNSGFTEYESIGRSKTALSVEDRMIAV